MSYAVVFHDEGAKIHHNITEADWAHVPNSLINPICPPGVPPHHWKKQGNEIVIMTKEEQEFMDARVEPPVDRREILRKYPDLVIAASEQAKFEAFKMGMYFAVFNGVLTLITLFSRLIK